jgi:hypothetical protein
MGYRDHAHRVQTAIAGLLARTPDLPRCNPKHLRTGIDLTKADMAGLATLLIEKGVFTQDEYIAAITRSAEIEADSYEQELQEAYGSDKIVTR